MEIIQFLVDKMLIVVPVLWVIGAILKSTPKVPNWCIPYVLSVLGIGAAFVIMGVTLESAVQGILVAGVAVLGHQFVKQGKVARS